MRSKLVYIFWLSLVGTLFAGSVTLRQYIAPTNIPGVFSCVGLKLWGLSPCPYGLAIFLVLALVSWRAWRGKSGLTNTLFVLLRLFSLIGVLFSGWVVWRELLAPAVTLGSAYWDTFSVARVPACAWGFVVFVAVAVLCWLMPSTSKTTEPTSQTPAAPMV